MGRFEKALSKIAKAAYAVRACVELPTLRRHLSSQKRRAQGANYPGPFSLVCSRLSLIGLSFPRHASSCESETNAPGDALFQKKLKMIGYRHELDNKRPGALGIRAFRNHSRFGLNGVGLPQCASEFREPGTMLRLTLGAIESMPPSARKRAVGS